MGIFLACLPVTFQYQQRPLVLVYRYFYQQILQKLGKSNRQNRIERTTKTAPPILFGMRWLVIYLIYIVQNISIGLLIGTEVPDVSAEAIP